MRRCFRRARYAAIQVGGSEFDSVSRHHPGIETIEPARSQFVPRSSLHDGVIMNAVAPRLGKRSIRNLIHPHRTRSRPVHLERFWPHCPTPIRPHHRIARSFHLRESCEKVRCDHLSCMLSKDRRVLSPRFEWCLIERAAHGKEQLRWLADGLVGPVDRQPKREDASRADDELHE